MLQSDWKESGVPFYRAREIVKLSDNGYVDNELFISEEHYKKLSNEYGVPKAGDLMVSGVGTIGKTYVVKENDKFYYKDASVLCFSKKYDYLSSKFYRFVLESNFLRQQMNEGSKGTTVDTITISTASNYLVVLPPIKEQNKITNMVIQYLEFVDSIHDSKEQLSLLIRNTKFKILDLAIQGKLVPQDPNDEPASVLLERIQAEKEELIKQGKIKRDKKESVIFKGDDNSYYEKMSTGEVKCIDDELPFVLPKDWEWARLKSICEPISDGTHQTPRYTDEGYIFLSSKNVTGGCIDWQNVMYISESLHNKLYKRIAPQKNDILLAKNGTTGVAALVDKDYIFDIYVTLALIRTIGYQVHPKYILCVFASNTTQYYFKKSLKGIGVPNLHLEQIRETLVPVPPENEQVKIHEAVENLNRFIEMIEANLN